MRAALAAVALCACQGTSPPPPSDHDQLRDLIAVTPHTDPSPPSPAPAPTSADPVIAAAQSLARGAGVALPAAPTAIDAGTPPADAKPPPGGRGDAVITLAGIEHPLRFGVAISGPDGITLRLFEGFADCNTPVGDDAPSTELRFVVPPGPGPSYFAGQPTFVEMRLEVPDRYQMTMLGDGATVTLAPVRVREGARVRGELADETTVPFGKLSARGHFDVAICSDEPPPPGMRGVAPDGPLRGRHGKTALAPKKIFALARKDDDSGDRALVQLALFDDAKATCPTSLLDSHPPMSVFPLGGTSQQHPGVGARQPTTLAFSTATESVVDAWPAWIRFDKPYDPTPGKTVRGELWAEPASYDDDAEHHGSFGGHFEATVCDVP